MQKNPNIVEAIKLSADYLEKKGVESGRLNVELALCKILDCERVDLYANFDKPLTDQELDRLRKFLKKRAERIPLQYLLGSARFYGMEFAVNSSVISPRPETEILAEKAIEIAKNRNFRKILEIGTGSGCLTAALAANLPEAEILSVDSSPEALELAASNLKRLGLTKVRLKLLDILKRDFDGRYDMIVSNPPYISKNNFLKLEPEVNRYEPRAALTDEADGLTFYRRFAELLDGSPEVGGVAAFEIDSDQADRIKEIFRLAESITILKDYSGHDRVAIIEK